MVFVIDDNEEFYPRKHDITKLATDWELIESIVPAHGTKLEPETRQRNSKRNDFVICTYKISTLINIGGITPYNMIDLLDYHGFCCWCRSIEVP